MPPQFPPVERIQLAESTLELVVCQLRFPTVLALAGNQPPEAFQRRIHKEYPIARRNQTASVAVSVGASAQMSVASYWSFEDRDRCWTVSLETTQYSQFSDFRDRFLDVVKVAQNLYPVGLRERLGLRYVDRLSRERQPRLPSDWPDRIREEIIPLRRIRGEGEPQLSTLESRFAFGQNILTIRAQYVDRGFPGAAEDHLVLDFDCFTEERDSLDGLGELLLEFKGLTYRAYRWAIGDLIYSLPAAQHE